MVLKCPICNSEDVETMQGRSGLCCNICRTPEGNKFRQFVQIPGVPCPEEKVMGYLRLIPPKSKKNVPGPSPGRLSETSGDKFIEPKIDQSKIEKK